MGQALAARMDYGYSRVFYSRTFRPHGTLTLLACFLLNSGWTVVIGRHWEEESSKFTRALKLFYYVTIANVPAGYWSIIRV